MPQLIWTPRALRDVERVYRFLMAKSPDAAKHAVGAIRKGVQALELQPHIGRMIEDLEVEFREWIIDFGNDGYVVWYRLDAEQVTILAVRHQKEAGY